MQPLYTVTQIRQIETESARRLSEGALMQRAGQASANAALDLLPFATSRASVLVLAGPGNNGGDALEAAAHLAHAGAQVAVVYFEGGSAPERARAVERAHASPARFVAEDAIAGVEWHLVIDGLFGIGLTRPITGPFAALVAALNALTCPILALDVPSGLDADTGCIVGPAGCAVRATHTLTFIGDKPGLHTCDGRDHAGTVNVAHLDIDAAHYPAATIHLNGVDGFAQAAVARPQNSHKGSYGIVSVLGGAPGMTGAPILAGRAALHAGAGRVFLCFAGPALQCDPGQPELMCRAAHGFDFATGVTVAGPGLGGSDEAAHLLEQAIASPQPLVVDADGLNLVAARSGLAARLRGRKAATLLTPHPLEAARLLATSIGAIQRDRLDSARRLAAALHAIVVLKGTGTVIAAPGGAIVINPTGNPALATAGTGDVLAGLCGALLAQGWPGWEAALGAVWLHGMAADVLVADGIGPVGLTAGELVPAIRTALNRLVARHGRRA
ncbi:NAD(P)H-hydrate dehydratase [[Empedobacter] haloabium]|uniref:Bifunctional NAD(P)H-hydrate repair enzyme n=1 Tax=[Empedobacter] haloabium TaxID=592317 RepID=A0ABZ1UTQ9_9BURK